MSITVTGMNLSITLNMFGIGPMATCQCNKCNYAWKQRLIPGINEPLIVCPNCKHSVKLIGMGWGSLGD